MSFYLRIQVPGQEPRFETVDGDRFWLTAGSIASPPDREAYVALPIEGYRGELVEVRCADGDIEVRAEGGLPIHVKTSAGTVAARFEPLLEGEGLLVDSCRIDLQWESGAPPQWKGVSVAELSSETETNVAADADAGRDLRNWFESSMALADRLDGVREIDELVDVVLTGVLASTAADRVFVLVDTKGAEAREWFLSRQGGAQPFGVSRSLVARVRREQGLVFVPESASDPLVAGLLSVRREGISSSLAVPLRALGASIGVLYADCVEPGHSLGTDDFQKAALLGRMFAGAIGSRELVRSVLDPVPAMPPGLLSRSSACRGFIDNARLFAPTDYTILIRGETGAGKEVTARGVHAISRRSSGPFVAVNSAAIPAQLMESELFGHVRGSFTGADSDREGFFVAASGGTLFLDEIGDMDRDLQAKMLRVLETKEVTPVGGTTPIAVDVRILAATHRDLEAMVREDAFREDLYFRLRELELRIPPLRERPEDIPAFAETFAAEAAQELGVSVPRISPEVIRVLVDHDWRGNVRELRHAMRTAVLRAQGGELTVEHIQLVSHSASASEATRENATAPREGKTWKEELDEQERRALQATLEEAGGNLTKAAMLFGLARTTYRERLVRHGLL